MAESHPSLATPEAAKGESGAERWLGLCRHGACQGYFALQ
jgi:hypothetical protein